MPKIRFSSQPLCALQAFEAHVVCEICSAHVTVLRISLRSSSDVPHLLVYNVMLSSLALRGANGM
jgi:hypothetical protein